jgi:hypothetical protein
MVSFNHVRPHDALGGKTPSEVYRDSPRSLGPAKIPTYPPDWLTRRASHQGFIRVNGDSVFVGSALARQNVGLKQETELTWRARYFDIDLGTIEIFPINDAFCSDTVVRTVNAIQAKQGLRELSTVSAQQAVEKISPKDRQAPEGMIWFRVRRSTCAEPTSSRCRC